MPEKRIYKVIRSYRRQSHAYFEESLVVNIPYGEKVVGFIDINTSIYDGLVFYAHSNGLVITPLGTWVCNNKLLFTDSKELAESIVEKVKANASNS